MAVETMAETQFAHRTSDNVGDCIDNHPGAYSLPGMHFGQDRSVHSKTNPVGWEGCGAPSQPGMLDWSDSGCQMQLPEQHRCCT